MQKVEELPADVRLTDTVCLLQDAQNKVADYVDGKERNHKYYHCQECGFQFVLADNASVNDMKIFDSFKIFHMNPKLNIPCRNELVEVNKEDFLRLFD
jgi:transposase-like protein